MKNCPTCGSRLTTIDIDLPDEEILMLAKIAHEENITLNQLIVTTLLGESNRVIDSQKGEDEDGKKQEERIQRNGVC